MELDFGEENIFYIYKQNLVQCFNFCWMDGQRDKLQNKGQDVFSWWVIFVDGEDSGVGGKGRGKFEFRIGVVVGQYILFFLVLLGLKQWYVFCRGLGIICGGTFRLFLYLDGGLS